MDQQIIARALLEIDAVGFSPKQPVTFKSGIVSPVYVDNRRLSFHPAQWQIVIQGFAALITQQSLAFDVLAGVAVGGIPHSAALAYLLQQPSVFVRKETKTHGAKKQVEGGDVTEKRILLIEDMVTTGGSSLDAVEILRSAGATVNAVLAIVSYGFAEAQQAFSTAGVTLHTLTHFDVILNEARQLERFTEDEAAVIRDWFDDPHGWAQRQGFV